jgi:hypothetical protein
MASGGQAEMEESQMETTGKEGGMSEQIRHKPML